MQMHELQSNSLTVQIDVRTDGPCRLRAITDRISGVNFIGGNAELFEWSHADRTIPASRFCVNNVHTARIDGNDAIVVELTDDTTGASVRMTWRVMPSGAVRWAVQSRHGDESTDGVATLRFPFIEEMMAQQAVLADDDSSFRSVFLGQYLNKHAGHTIVGHDPDYGLPFVLWHKDTRRGLSMLFSAGRYEYGAWIRSAGRLFTEAAFSGNMRSAAIAVRPSRGFTALVEADFYVHDAGLDATFAALRTQYGHRVRQDEYVRDDLAWYRNHCTLHFTFMYGKEIFNHTTRAFDLEALLAESRRFGGFDGILLWLAYPRIGIDSRTQWELYDDVPGGKAALRALVGEAHRLGIKVFVPFLPWDVGVNDGQNEVAINLSRLIEELDVDGVFLDTMDSVPHDFRRVIDARRQGVVFCCEARPAVGDLPLITGSWDQVWDAPMPQLNMLRFLFPRHSAFVIDRHATGHRRHRMISRAVWNGTGLVVWQDVFGTPLPYADDEAATVAKWKRVYDRYRSAFRGEQVTPLVHTLADQIFCNKFACQHKTVYTLYNTGARSYCGPLLAMPHLRGGTATDVWTAQQVQLCNTPTGAVLLGTVPPADVTVIVVEHGEDPTFTYVSDHPELALP